jgi:hypothetical protein
MAVWATGFKLLVGGQGSAALQLTWLPTFAVFFEFSNFPRWIAPMEDREATGPGNGEGTT